MLLRLRTIGAKAQHEWCEGSTRVVRRLNTICDELYYFDLKISSAIHSYRKKRI